MIDEKPYQRTCMDKKCEYFGHALVDRGYNNLVCPSTNPTSEIRQFGVQEWATVSENTQVGCSNGCLYCYAFLNATRRKQVKNYLEWVSTRSRKTITKPKKTEGLVMMPTTHDISSFRVEQTFEQLEKHLILGNRVLIVTKPHPNIIRLLCSNYLDYQNQITFRFSITAHDPAQLEYWEPGAPTFTQRILSIQEAHEAGFDVSISIEPLLENPLHLVQTLKHYLKMEEVIWIGRMNHMDQVKKFWKDKPQWDIHQWNFLCMASDPDMIKLYYKELSEDPQIRWKESILKIVEAV